MKNSPALSPDKPREHCGIFGIFDYIKAIEATEFGLFALQHRGQEGAGIVVSNGQRFTEHRGLGLVNGVFQPENIRKLQGTSAIGHLRYSTCGSSGDALRNIQPICGRIGTEEIAVGHNGNFTNVVQLKKMLRDVTFQTDSDTECVLHLLARSVKTTLVGKLKDALCQIHGAYSLVLLTNDALIGARDPIGFRPLVLGELNGSYILASETCALDILEAKFIREIDPGEIVIITKSGIESHRIGIPKQIPGLCIFEYIYFSYPGSTMVGQSVSRVRLQIGRVLARERPVDADIVIPVPDSGQHAAIGFARESGIEYDLGLIRSHYIGRTFIDPVQMDRRKRVNLKFSGDKAVLDGRNVAVIDDSLVRGTTMAEIIRMIRRAGAKEIHVRISSPPIKHPCFHGMDFPDPSKLIAPNKTEEEIAKEIKADSLGYLSEAGLAIAVANAETCNACFSGKYLGKIPELT